MRAFYQFIVWRSAAITEPDIPSPTDPVAGWTATAFYNVQRYHPKSYR